MAFYQILELSLTLLVFIPISIIDIREKRIPNAIILPGILLLFLVKLFFSGGLFNWAGLSFLQAPLCSQAPFNWAGFLNLQKSFNLQTPFDWQTLFRLQTPFTFQGLFNLQALFNFEELFNLHSPLLWHLVNPAVGYLSFLALGCLTKGKIGQGDAKLSAYIALLNGLLGWLFSVLAASLLGIVAFTILYLSGKMDRKDSIPFAPFLSSGALIIYITLDPLLNFILNV
jgi:prepilin signal peptidase PulO-like enzyme (type II secretory pathway)